MVKIVKGAVAVVVVAMIIVAIVATLVYAQQDLGSVAELLRRQ